MSWQPIETAPTDGTEFLAVNVHQPHSIDVVQHAYEDDGTHYFWRLGDRASDRFTHWMPLPALPVLP
jgi:hypothetical protein